MAAAYSDLQVAPAHYVEESGLQLPDYSGLQRNEAEAYYAPRLEDKAPSLPLPPHSRRTICGLATRTFWILLAVIIAIVVIGAAVGGGVGGSIAAKNSKKSSNNAILSSSVSAQSVGTTSSPATSSPATSLPATSLPTASSPTASSPTTSSPTTSSPTTSSPTTSSPTTSSQTTSSPTASSPTSSPITSSPTTSSPTTTSPESTSAPTSSPSTGPITPSPTSTQAVTTTQIVESSTTLLSDCPSSNETLYTVNIGGDMIFRKLCSLGYVNAFGSTSVVNQRTTSLDDCIDLCASYNVQDETQIKSGSKLKCNTVCWRNGNDAYPGECYGYTTTQNTSDVSVAIANPICDTGTWLNPTF